MGQVVASPSKLAETLQRELNTARKAQDKPRTLLLGTLLAAIKNREFELQRAPTDDEIVDVLRRGIKTRRESVELYQKGGRSELAAAEAAEIAMLQAFLPPDVDPVEIRAAVRTAIQAGASDVGRVMGQVMPQFKGRADGKLINQIVREELQAG